MTCSVLGFDLSTRAVDIVALNENSNRAEWLRIELRGDTAWDRALSLRSAMPDDSWYGDRGVFLCAIETPVNDQKRVLRLIQGAVIASLPPKLRQPHCCWDVHPSTWKAGLGLRAKPGLDDLERIAGTRWPFTGSEFRDPSEQQNARDAYCLALYARDTNAKAVEKALGTGAA